MSAQALLREIRGYEIAIQASGDQLIVEGPAAALSDDVVARLQAAKPDLLMLLGHQSRSHAWDAEDWLAYFDERAAIREWDGGLCRDDAEHHAFEDTATQWLRLNPVPPSDFTRV